MSRRPPPKTGPGWPAGPGPAMPTVASGLPGRGWKTAGVCSLLVVLVFLVFGQTIGHQFINFDDNTYVYDNPRIQNGLDLGGIVWAFTHVHSDNWHPLTTITHMADCQMYGLWAGGHHLTNVVLHAAAAVMLFFALGELTGAFWRSAFVAAVFAIHPLRVESVAWVAERKDVLSGIFFMLTLWAYARYVRQPAKRWGYAMVAGWFVAGLMSKPMLVTVPFVLLLLDYWPLGRLQRAADLPGLLVEKLPLMVFSFLSCLATLYSQTSTIRPLDDFPIPIRMENALVAYMAYLGKLVYPVRLVVFYPLWKGGWPLWEVVLAGLLLGSLTVLAWVLRRKYPVVVVGWCWFLGMLVPVIGLVRVGVQAYADRYTYLPLIGPVMVLVWVAADCSAKWRHRKVVLGGVAAVLLGFLAPAAHRQASYWRDDMTLWTYVLGCSRDNYVAHNNLGMALLLRQQIEEAEDQFLKSLAANPIFSKAFHNLGCIRMAQQRWEEAEVFFRKAVELDPSMAEARINRGNVLSKLGRLEEAAALYRQALDIRPDYPEAHNNLGNLHMMKGRRDEAEVEYKEALRLKPDYSEAHHNLGNALLEQGRKEEGVVHLREVLRLNPANPEVLINLGWTLFELGYVEESVAQFREALRLRPGYPEAHNNLGSALYRQGRVAEAIGHMEKSVELQPSNWNTKQNLALMLVAAPEPQLRNGARAIWLALQVNEDNGGGNPVSLYILAAAYAEAGEYAKGLQTAQKAMPLALAQSNTVVADKLQDVIKRCQAVRGPRKIP